MSVTLRGREYENIYHQLSGYWNNLMGQHGQRNLEGLYQMGVPRRSADTYLWDLDAKCSDMLEREGFRVTFTYGEIDELERQLKLIEADSYGQELKDAVDALLTLLKNDANYRRYKINIASKSKGMNQAVRNVFETKTGQSAGPGSPANLIRGFAGIKVPKGAEGGKRSRKARKTKKARKGSRRHR